MKHALAAPDQRAGPVDANVGIPAVQVGRRLDRQEVTVSPLVIAAGWLTIGAIAVAVMHRRGHDTFAWAVLFLCMGPLAIPLAVSSHRHRPPDPDSPSHPGRLDVLVADDGSPEAAAALKSALDLLGAQMTSAHRRRGRRPRSHLDGARARHAARDTGPARRRRRRHRRRHRGAGRHRHPLRRADPRPPALRRRPRVRAHRRRLPIRCSLASRRSRRRPEARHARAGAGLRRTASGARTARSRHMTAQ